MKKGKLQKGIISTGFESLDNFGALVPGEITLVVGWDEVGFVRNLVKNVAIDKKLSVAMVLTEMSRHTAAKIFTKLIFNLPRRLTTIPKGKEAIAESLAIGEHKALRFMDVQFPDIKEVQKFCETMPDLRLLVIDTANFTHPNAHTFLRALKKFAVERNIAAIVGYEISWQRKWEKDSIAWADLSMHRLTFRECDKVLIAQEPDDGMAWVSVSKNHSAGHRDTVGGVQLIYSLESRAYSDHPAPKKRTQGRKTKRGSPP